MVGQYEYIEKVDDDLRTDLRISDGFSRLV